ncbi:unnamed protein product [Cercospora beticola]|nr:unnamed protein product [Cercospora beticola]
MNELRKKGVAEVIACPDASRSGDGAWLLDTAIPFETMIHEMLATEPSLTPAACMQGLRAVWDENWYARFERFSAYNSPSFCRDATRSTTGEWILPDHVPVETLIPSMKSRDPSLTTAECFQKLNAAWDDPGEGKDWAAARESHSISIHFFLDPIKTKQERSDRTERDDHGDIISHQTGADYTGAWGMTMRQKAAADRLKEAHPERKWSECYAEAGGVWGWHYRRVEDEGGRTAEEMVDLDGDQSICAEHDRWQAHLQHMLALRRQEPGVGSPKI